MKMRQDQSDESEIEEVVSQAPHATEGEGNIVSNQRQGNIQNQGVLPVGGVPRHPRASEVPQATSLMAEGGGQGIARPATATLARETSEDPTSIMVEGHPEDPTSLMEGPPHGIQIEDLPDDHDVQTCKEEKEKNTTYLTEAEHESSSEYTWGATNYLPEPTWGGQHGAWSEVTRQEELRMWEEANVNKLYQHRLMTIDLVPIWLVISGFPVNIAVAVIVILTWHVCATIVVSRLLSTNCRVRMFRCSLMRTRCGSR
jgi:hypothetical protein